MLGLLNVVWLVVSVCLSWTALRCSAACNGMRYFPVVCRLKLRIVGE